MSNTLDRRQFLGGSAGVAAALGLGAVEASAASGRPEPPTGRPKKSVMFTMLPGGLSLEARFQLARDVGFEGVEAPPIGDEQEANAMRAAAEKAGIPIHSVIYGGWE